MKKLKKLYKKVVPHGKGTMTLIDGSRITGEFENGKIDTTKEVQIINSTDLYSEDKIDITDFQGFLDKYNLSTLFHEQSNYQQDPEMNHIGFRYKGKINPIYEFNGNGEITIGFYKDDKLMYKLVYTGEFSDGDMKKGEFKSERMLIEGELVSSINYVGEFENDYSFAGEGELNYESLANTDLFGFKITRVNLQRNGELYTSKSGKYESDCGVINIKYLVDDTVQIKVVPKDNNLLLKDNDLFKFYDNITYTGKIKDEYKLIEGILELRKNGKIQSFVINNQNEKEKYLGAFISYNKLLVLDGEFYFRREKSLVNFRDEDAGHHIIFDKKMLWMYGYTMLLENDLYDKDFQKFMEQTLISGIGTVFAILIGNILGVGLALTGAVSVGKLIQSYIGKEIGFGADGVVHHAKNTRNLKFISSILVLLKLKVKSNIEKIRDTDEKINRIFNIYREIYSDEDEKSKKIDNLKSCYSNYKNIYDEMCIFGDELSELKKYDVRIYNIIGYYISGLINDVEMLTKIIKEIDNSNNLNEESLKEISERFKLFYKGLENIIDKTEKYILTH